MNLQHMILEIIAAMGGITEATEYALAHVLLPEAYKERFQGRTELVLAFDYEVAEEHPEAEFVTFGSEITEEFLDIALNTPLSDSRFVIVDRVEVYGAKERIKRMSNGGMHEINVLSERPVMGMWAMFTFRARFVSSESFEEERRVYINMLTGEQDVEIESAHIFFESEPTKKYPYAPACSISDAYKRAKKYMRGIADIIAKSVANPSKVRFETERIMNYYEELIIENNRRLTRKGITPEREEDIRQKHKNLELEMDRQLREIQENLIPTYTVELAHGITLHIPLIEIVCGITNRNETMERTFYYDCLLKRVV